MKNLPDKILRPKAATSKGNYIDGLIIMLVLLWIGFLLFTTEKIQPVEPAALIEAYMKNLGVLLKDKVYFLSGLTYRQ